MDSKYRSSAVFLLGQSKHGDDSTWAGGPVKETVQDHLLVLQTAKKIQVLC